MTHLTTWHCQLMNLSTGKAEVCFVTTTTTTTTTTTAAAAAATR